MQRIDIWTFEAKRFKVSLPPTTQISKSSSSTGTSISTFIKFVKYVQTSHQLVLHTDIDSAGKLHQSLG